MVIEPAEIPDALQAGVALMATSVVVLNGAKQKVTKGYLAGERQQYAVTQRIWYCPEGDRSILSYAIGSCL